MMFRKNCTQCGIPFESTVRNKRLCSECKRERRFGYARRNPKQRMLTCARSRAKEENVPFDLTEDDISIPEYCPVLGIKLESAVGKGSYTDYSPSLDKSIPSLGYTRGNVSVISMRANLLKNNASIEELEKVITWMSSIKPYRERVIE